ncbi:MAG: hypothetical protein ABI821_11495 [Pseudomonadota bacterium]
MRDSGLSLQDFLASSEFWAAFAGAAAAFALEAIRSWKERGREQTDAANRALLTLMQMYADLHDLWHQIYLPSTERVQQRWNRPPIALEIAPAQGNLEPSPQVEMASVAFLLQTHDPNIVSRIQNAERRYLGDLSSERLRGSLHLEAQTVMQAAGVREGQQYTPADAERIIGQVLMRQLDQLTDAQRNHIPRTLKTIEDLLTDLTDVASLKLPSRRIVMFQAMGEQSRTKRRLAAPWRYGIRFLFRATRKWLTKHRIT